MDVDVDNKPSKQHKVRKAGRKAEKRKLKEDNSREDATTKKKNPKAYAIQSVNKLAKSFHRAQDIKTKKHHIPVVDRTPQVPPPVVVAIVGPPKVGKTTLLQCIIKNYTKQKLTNIQGPVTVVSGKNRRLTIIECPNDISAMIDIAKIADLVLLLVDAGFGFEMETFEFLNICQVHGMPKIMGVLTHLDAIDNAKKIKKTKKLLKHRFWTEIYQGAKLFYLSRMVYGEYQKMEIHNLCRFISVMKFRPLIWRSTHSYLLTDRMEDLTDPEKIRQDSICNRNISLYGYVRGMPLKNHSSIHIPGVGDQIIKNISFLPDPCPLPEKGEKRQRRTLDVKERLIYAPMSGVGGIIYDKDAVYIDVQSSTQRNNGQVGEIETIDNEIVDDSMIGTMTLSKQTIDHKMEKSQFSLLEGMKPITNNEAESMVEMPMEEKTFDVETNRVRRRAVFSIKDGEQQDSTSNDDEEGYQSGDSDDESCNESENEIEEPNGISESKLKWKENLKLKAQNLYIHRQKMMKNLPKLVYGKIEIKSDTSESEEDEKVAGDLFVVKRNMKAKKNTKDNKDCSITLRRQHGDENSEDIRRSISDCFVTGDWNQDEDASHLLQEDENLYGDFEDLETGQSFTSGAKDNESDSDDVDTVRIKKPDDREARLREKRLARKRKMKEIFDREYDVSQENGEVTTASGSLFDSVKTELAEQAKLNRAEFEDMDDATRVQYEGYRPGMYVRIELHDIPCEFVKYFNPTYPVIAGGLLATEIQTGFIRVRVKKHRWYPKILKTRNPMIFSMGWRRFQSLPMYYMEDHNLRQRYLKYTPQNMHCWAVMWGPLCPQGTGFLAIQALANRDVPNFRITASGTILESDKSTKLVKKLKLIGYPYKIFKNTCFVKGMFNSSLEVAKFEGAAIRTVSGIRGQIKRAVTDGPNNSGGSEAGSFRASFEDRILMSDIVFCRTWCPVDVPKFFLNCANLMLPDKDSWSAMKTVGQLRHEKDQKLQPNEDSLYGPIERETRVFNPVVIPKKLQKELPYKVRPKLRREKIESRQEGMMKVAIVREPKDRKIVELMTALRALDHDKKKKTKQEKRVKYLKHREMLEKEEIKNKWKHKEAKRKAYAMLNQKQKKKR
uniref:ribosome biogenesis protein BMS1 homolog n=1 Tax=Styela clava TaxID=7725 RepID=UPI00193A7BCE|nr:ribosome biogenesis protein BMS1 homolog [Styela clava]